MNWAHIQKNHSIKSLRKCSNILPYGSPFKNEFKINPVWDWHAELGKQVMFVGQICEHLEVKCNTSIYWLIQCPFSQQ